MDSATAKQFLISRVVEGAKSAGVPLSEIERKMLYFSEVNPSLPDISDVNVEFEKSYDADEYENKITTLLRKARDFDERQSDVQGQQWRDAIDALKHEDHYILVMVYRAFPRNRKAILPTHRVRDYLIYVAVGLTVVFIAILAAIWSR